MSSAATKPATRQWAHVDLDLLSRVAACLTTGANMPVGNDAESRNARDAHACQCDTLSHELRSNWQPESWRR